MTLPAISSQRSEQDLLNTIPAHSTSALLVNLKSIQRNFNFLQSCLTHGGCGAVVKANAYGLGAKPVTAALIQAGCQHFFIAHLEEALELRSEFPDIRLYSLTGLLPGCEEIFTQYRVVPVLNDLHQIKRWHEHARALGRMLPAIIQFNTGMCRNGLDPKDTEKFLNIFAQFDGIDVLFYMSHLVASETPSNAINTLQLEKLRHISSRLPQKPVTFANSGGIFLGKDFHFDLARPGKALYGMHPVPGNDHLLTPALSVYARVVQVSEYPAGETVGYDHTYKLTRNSRLATVALGYADGYLRSLSNRGLVYFQQYAAPVLGRISMDYTIIDVTDVPPSFVHPGDWAEVVNPQMTLSRIGDLAGTIARELMVHLDSRHHRLYL